ncbi:DEAD/DEAH box helicase family protein [Fluviicola sp.]|uniref:DEAD/DEAH box helicase family protein n=1 Tax=Fluviicola sp. TaxID=1917219 RepID=UPI0031DF8373
MTTFPKEAKFKYSWRKYQQRVLNELQDHLNDKHLHVIAPPGSGKTILGLEVMLRLNKPTLILAPTIAIRNQWAQRFCELFLEAERIPEWISFDIRTPHFLTIVTYQGLHAACNNLNADEPESEEEEMEENGFVKSSNPNLDAVVAGLQSKGIQTIVVDEAHHLKNEWWNTLTKVKKKLDPVVIGLTATPPYDVSVGEWQRYVDLNGPVDAEISVPELVVEGDLCPHQDYVYFNLPTPEENQKIVEFRQRVESQYQELKNDQILIQALENHRIWLDPMNHLEWIYENLPYYSATLIFLNANGRIVPETHLEILGDKELKIPVLDYSWTETLLSFYLFSKDEQFISLEEHRKQLEDRLRRCGVLERKQLNFTTNPKITGALSASLGKLNSIREIVRFESEQLGTKLRMVILSDYIRKEFFVDAAENREEITKLGVIPVFEKLRRETESIKLGILTGSLILIPKSSCAELEKLASNSGIEKIEMIPVPYDADYVQVLQTERVKNHLVHLITQIFQQGEIEVLIGTKSLLGEGWDAPAINSLILASFVGSFVLSNQMRGRAIRRQHTNPEKTGNIWHLVTVDTSSAHGGDDLDLLKRRFKGFVGVSFNNDPVIENGIGRLNLPQDFSDTQTVINKNNETKTVAADRESLKKRWKTALAFGKILIEEIKIPFSDPKGKSYEDIQSLYFTKTIASLIASLVSGVLIYLDGIIQALSRSARHIRTLQGLYIFLTVIGVLGLLIFGRLAYKTLRMYLKYRDISKDIQRIGEALVSALINSGIINTPHSELKVEAVRNKYGGVYCHLSGGTTFEKSTFIQALRELIVPINNPRYIIERRSYLAGVLQQIDYHSVPDLISRNKSQAEFFEAQWKQRVGSCYLIYTRTKEGRKLLLKSRLKSLSAQMDEIDPEHVNKWV